MDIPICDIVPSAYDILRTIRLAQGMGDDFAIVGYPSITHPAEKLCEIMQFSIPTVTIRSPQECREKLAALRDKGTRIIVGDMISATCAQEYGMHGLLIVSGMESIESAINTAKDICLRYQTLDRRASLLRDLLVSDERDCAVYSPDGREVFATLDPVPPELADAMRQHVSHVLAHSSVKLSRRLGNEMSTVRGGFSPPAGRNSPFSPSPALLRSSAGGSRSATVTFPPARTARSAATRSNIISAATPPRSGCAPYANSTPRSTRLYSSRAITAPARTASRSTSTAAAVCATVRSSSWILGGSRKGIGSFCSRMTARRSPIPALRSTSAISMP